MSERLSDRDLNLILKYPRQMIATVDDVQSLASELRERRDSDVSRSASKENAASDPFRCENCGEHITDKEPYALWADEVRTHIRCPHIKDNRAAIDPDTHLEYDELIYRISDSNENEGKLSMLANLRRIHGLIEKKRAAK